jgi:hypothetical protein
MPHFLDNQLSDGDGIVSLTRRSALYCPGNFLVLMFAVTVVERFDAGSFSTIVFIYLCYGNQILIV